VKIWAGKLLRKSLGKQVSNGVYLHLTYANVYEVMTNRTTYE